MVESIWQVILRLFQQLLQLVNSHQNITLEVFVHTGGALSEVASLLDLMVADGLADALLEP